MVVPVTEEFLDAPMPKVRKSTLSQHKPEDWPRLFEQYLNTGALEAVVALYETEARFVARSGETVIGRDQIRKVLAGMIGAKTRLHSQVSKAVTVGDIALLSQTLRARRSMARERRSRFTIRRLRSCAASPTATGS
jgi:hypothetical protein